MSRIFQLALLAACLIGCAPGDTVVQNEPSENKAESNDSTAPTEQKPDQKEMADQNDNPKQAESEDLETFEDIKNKHKQAFMAYMKRYRAAPTRADKLKEYRNQPTLKPYYAKLTELVNKAPDSPEKAHEAASWWYSRERKTDNAKMILQLIVDQFSDSELMAGHVHKLPEVMPKPKAEKILRAMIDTNPSVLVKARSVYYLRTILKERSKKIEGEKAEMVNAELKSLENLLMTEYADQAEISGYKFRRLMEADAFAAKLEIGKPVPDIAGTDLDGIEFKLSDYRGKVTMISFWGFW